MLGKLIKHEWKEASKGGVVMLIGVVLVSFMGWIAFQSPLWKSMGKESAYYAGFGLWDVLSFITLFLYVLMLVGLNYGIIVYLGVRFYKTMYTDEGYLIHTLPVGKHQLLLSKLLVSSIWSLIIILGVVASVIILMLSLVGAILPEDYTLGQALGEFFRGFGEVLQEIREESGIDLFKYLVSVIIATVAGPVTTMATLFGAISIGQLFTKHRVLMAIVSYILILLLNSFINSIVNSLTASDSLGDLMFGVGDMDHYLSTVIDSSMIISLIFAVILYFVSWFVISRKLNLE